MKQLKAESEQLVWFFRAASFYFRKRTREAWRRFEEKKNTLVEILITKRGTYQRPFLHTSFFVLVGAGIVAAPIIHNTYPTQANQLEEFTPPSAVFSSLDEQETLTQISEKPRDTVVNYTVEDGDTLSTIAEKFSISVDTIKWANPTVKETTLKPGQDLSIPPVTGLVIKVQKGETIYSIAKKYQTDPQKILNFPFNDFSDLDTFALAAGQQLVVPDGVVPEAKPVYTPQTIATVGVTPGDGQFIWPTQGRVTQYPVSYHMALDIANNALPAIMAADSGKVILVEYAKYGYGHHVIIDHGNGYQTLYGHMSEIYVSPGQNVSKASVIGKMGSTGRSSGPHLHFEIRRSGILLNPLGFLK